MHDSIICCQIVQRSCATESQRWLKPINVVWLQEAELFERSLEEFFAILVVLIVTILIQPHQDTGNNSVGVVSCWLSKESCARHSQIDEVEVDRKIPLVPQKQFSERGKADWANQFRIEILVTFEYLLDERLVSCGIAELEITVENEAKSAFFPEIEHARWNDIAIGGKFCIPKQTGATFRPPKATDDGLKMIIQHQIASPLSPYWACLIFATGKDLCRDSACLESRKRIKKPCRALRHQPPIYYILYLLLITTSDSLTRS